MPEFSFRTSHEHGSARLGWFQTPHGLVETPDFMPVGTHGVVRGLSMDEVAAAGARMVLANAYHLYLRPGDMMVRALGGLHAFARWSGPMLTDSGGFQLFSLSRLRTVGEEGVEFQSHIDGSMHQYTPESVMRIERNIGADVIMQLDELIQGQSDVVAARCAMERSLRWLRRCRTEFERISREGREPLPDFPTPSDAPPLARDIIAPVQTLFPIVQGGTHADLRRAAVAGIIDSGAWNGVAIGGLSVGETKDDTYAMLEVCDPVIPRTLPRYLMGVGFPDDLIEGVRRGIDLFDCVAPTRMGRHGTAFTPDGKVQIRQSGYRTDRRPLVEDCECQCCAQYDRAYLRHLFTSDEMLGKRLLALHNISFLISLMRDVRAALTDGTFDVWSDHWLERYRAAGDPPRAVPPRAEPRSARG
ncbi:MAG TPA: tRNA guanosine(34) transglycosylase Tgt [Gemmatimonadaceae bacterium]